MHDKDLIDKDLIEEIQRVHEAALFKTRTSDEEPHVVDSPFLGPPISSSFERVVRFVEPAIEVGRLGVHEVHFVCAAFDAVCDDLSQLDQLRTWTVDGAISVRRMAGGRCCGAPSPRVPQFKTTVGVAPEQADACTAQVMDELRTVVKAGKAHAIGLCGLLPQASDAQTKVFMEQVQLASEAQLPLIVQANGCHQQVRGLLAQAGFPLQRVMIHTFEGSDEELVDWAQAGSYISFGAGSANTPELLCHQVKQVPAEQVLVESGAPEQHLNLLAGMPARCDQVVFVADAISQCLPMQQLAINTAAFFA